MIERHPVTIAVLCIALIVLATCLGTRAGAAGLLIATDSYQLDQGATVYTWLDERHGLFCSMVPQTGLSCVALTDTSYGWSIGK
jgi:hypothetical protein